MNTIQLPECGLFRKSAVLLAIFFAIILNVSAQVPSPAPVAAAGARDAQGNLVPGASATTERVIVTGSNIPTAEEVGPNPVDIYNQETMSKSGERTTEQFLQSLPTVNANVIPQSNNENGSNTAVGAASIALRGFDARATLILIDGRRVAPYPTANNPGLVNVMFVDLNAIPAAAAGGANLAPGSTEFASPPDLTNGLAPASTYLYGTSRPRALGGQRPGFDFNLFASSFPESERYGGYLAAEHKVFGDQLVLYADAYYENVKTHNEAAPPATGNFETKGQTTIVIPPHSPIAPGAEPPNTPTHVETGLPADAFNPFNPFDQIISGSTRARLSDFGNRLFDNETDAVLATLGVKGDKLFDGSWGYDAGWRYSQLKNVQVGQQVSAERFNRILNAADPIFDPNSPHFIGTTVPFNPFGDFRAPIASNAATINFARVHPKDEDFSKLWTLDASIYTTSLVELPGGDVGFAFGGQFRRESLEENPDILNEEGDIIGNSPVNAARGGRKSYSLYAEARIPIFGPKMNIPGLHSLEFDDGVRFEEFLNNDTNVLVPKFGMRWQPFDEQLTIRSTWSEGYRQPSLEELFSAPISTLFGTHDPLTGGAFEQETNTLAQSNKNLQPEDSRSFSAGFVYTPKYVPGLNLSVEFWDTERTGIVASPTAQQVLDREARGALLPGEAVERDPNTGTIQRILLSNQNLGSQEARGYDFTVQYQKPTAWGTFTSTTQVTYLDEFLFPQFIQSEFGPNPGNLAGRTTDPSTSNEGWYKWKGTSQLDWNWNHFDAIFTARYIDGFHEFLGNLNQHYVSQTWTFDVQATYDFTGLIKVENNPVPGYSKDAKEVARAKDGSFKETAAAQTANYGGVSDWRRILVDGTSITVGCNNITDRDPPFASAEDGSGQNYPGFTYDATNRFWYARLTKKF